MIFFPSVAIDLQVRSDTAKAKLDTLEKDAHQAKEQAAELARTATEYSQMLQKKESEMAELQTELQAMRSEHLAISKTISELEAQSQALQEALDNSTSERQRDKAARTKLQKEIDDLRNVMAAKASEDTRRSEVQRSKEKELVGLRAQTSKLQESLEEARRVSVETQSRLKIELEENQRRRENVEQAYKELEDHVTDNVEGRKKAEVGLAEAQKTVRSLESDVQSLRTKLVQTEGDLADATKAKEVSGDLICRSELTNVGLGVGETGCGSPVQVPGL